MAKLGMFSNKMSITIFGHKHFFMSLFYFSCPAFLGISGPPTPSCQKEQENHQIRPQMSRIGTRKVKETQKQHTSLSISGNTAENFSAIFPEIETTNVIFFVSLLLYESLFSGPLRSDFVILLLLLTARSRRTRNIQKSRTRKLKET